MKKEFAVIGLGRFGGSVAKTLHDMGYEVMVIDQDPNRVQDYAQFVTLCGRGRLDG